MEEGKAGNKLDVTCKCGKVFTISNDVGGRRFECPACGSATMAPGPYGTPAAPTRSVGPPASPSDASPDPATARLAAEIEALRRRLDRPSMTSVAALVLAAFAVALAGYPHAPSLWSGGEEAIPPPPVTDAYSPAYDPVPAYEPAKSVEYADSPVYEPAPSLGGAYAPAPSYEPAPPGDAYVPKEGYSPSYDYADAPKADYADAPKADYSPTYEPAPAVEDAYVPTYTPAPAADYSDAPKGE